MPTRVQDLIRELNKDGWNVAEKDAYSLTFKHPEKTGLVTLPRDGSMWLDRENYRSILKAAGLQ